MTDMTFELQVVPEAGEWLTPEVNGGTIKLGPIPDVPRGSRLYVVMDDLECSRYRWVIIRGWGPHEDIERLEAAQHDIAAWVEVQRPSPGGSVSYTKPLWSLS